MHAYNFLVRGPKFTNIFAQCERGCSWSSAFPIFMLSIRSADIRDQIRNGKLPEIKPNFGRFLLFYIL